MRAPDGYELGAAYARDRTGVFYRAVQKSLDRPVTLKALRDDLVDHDRARAIFLAERDIVTAIEHPNLLMVIDVGDVDGIPFFVTESTAEPTLAEALRNEEPLPEQRAVAVAVGIAQALHEIARKGLIYKNVRPQNVLLPRPATPKLVTFRHVRKLGEAKAFRRSNVQSAAYCAPELVRADLGPVTTRANVYALGALLYHMLAGRAPVLGSSADVRKVHAEAGVPPLKEVRSYLRDRAYAVVGALMTHDPAKRPETGTAVALLEAYRDDPLVTRPLKRKRRRR